MRDLAGYSDGWLTIVDQTSQLARRGGTTASFVVQHRTPQNTVRVHRSHPIRYYIRTVRAHWTTAGP
ncbi:MAG TPA: hypothetical protein VIE40_08200 [Dehalococcoidia bacterium]